MKNLFLALLVYTFLPACKSSRSPDSKQLADAKNEQKAERGTVDKDVAAFLVKIADARMMGAMEGQLATEKGTDASIKNYGQLMMKDQNAMLLKIKELAASKKITLLKEISDDKKDGYKDLAAKTGKDFDSKFIKMMRIDHKRDIKDFKDARDIKDAALQQFIDNYLPMIESHLDKLNGLEG